jgi:hypothetical protein
MPCSYCGKEKVLARGLCQNCYQRQWATGSVARKNARNIGFTCSHDGCRERAHAKGFCDRHYNQSRHPLTNTWKLVRSKYPGEFPASWKDFDAFLADVGERPGRSHQLRRKDMSRPYSCDNVRWVEPIIALKNRSEKDRRDYMHAWGIRKRFGFSPVDYESMAEWQNRQCAICLGPSGSYRDGRERKFCIDHDHETGKIRGLLCNGCNRGIGYFSDSPDNLRRAIAYLERHKEQAVG